MTNYTVKQDQSLFDVCLSVYGSLDYYADLVRDNDLNQDDTLTAGTIIVFDETKGDKKVNNYYTVNKIVPITNVLGD